MSKAPKCGRRILWSLNEFPIAGQKEISFRIRMNRFSSYVGVVTRIKNNSSVKTKRMVLHQALKRLRRLVWEVEQELNKMEEE